MLKFKFSNSKYPKFWTNSPDLIKRGNISRVISPKCILLPHIFSSIVSFCNYPLSNTWLVFQSSSKTIMKPKLSITNPNLTSHVNGQLQLIIIYKPSSRKWNSHNTLLLLHKPKMFYLHTELESLEETGYVHSVLSAVLSVSVLVTSLCYPSFYYIHPPMSL